MTKRSADEPTHARTFRVAAPAKLNLGLEVVGRRPDGFHDLVTIFQSIDVVDDVRLRRSPVPGIRCGLPGLADDQNLAVRALAAIRPDSERDGADLAVTKRIPAAAGLGGASSDAAAALRLGTALWSLPLDGAALARVALGLGSDVPFLLRCGTALAEGRGEILTSLPPLRDVWFVVVAPRVALPRKTATLFAMLTAGDFSDGRRVRDHAERLAATGKIDPDALGNAFSRPLAALRPDLAAWPERLRALGAPNVALSGAGPALYAVFADPAEPARLATRLANECGDVADVFVAHPVTCPPQVRIAYL